MSMKINALLLNLWRDPSWAFKVNEETEKADDQAEGIDRLERSIHMDLMDMFIREDTGRRKERDKDSRSSAHGGRSGLCLCI